MADAIDTIAVAIAAACSPSQATITFVGELERNRRQGPSRVVWIPRGGPVEPADQDEANTSKSCNQCREGCDIYFLATTREAARALMHAFLAGMFRSQTRHSARPTDYEHSTETISGANRHEIKLSVTVDIPVTFETYQAADIEVYASTTTVT
jgi:hypothetical protein